MGSIQTEKNRNTADKRTHDGIGKPPARKRGVIASQSRHACAGLMLFGSIAGAGPGALATAAATTTSPVPDPCAALTVPVADIAGNIVTIDGTKLAATLQADIAKAAAPAAGAATSKLSATVTDQLNFVATAIGKVVDKRNITTSPTEFAASLTSALHAGCESLTHGGNIQAAEVAAMEAGAFDGSRQDSQYTLYLGTVQALQAQGGFTSNIEASLISRTLFGGTRRKKDDPSPTTWDDRPFEGVFELTYSKIGALVAPASGSGSNGSSGTSGGSGSGGTSGSTTINPFTSTAGILRLNGSLEKQFFPTFGALVGAGLTTIPQSQGSSSEVRSRWFAALEVLANYGVQDNAEHTTGRLLLGFADDKFWDAVAQATPAATATPSQPKRLFLDARLDTPGLLSSKSVKLSLRLFADSPSSGHGPSDIRISLLVSTSVQSLFGGS